MQPSNAIEFRTPQSCTAAWSTLTCTCESNCNACSSISFNSMKNTHTGRSQQLSSGERCTRLPTSMRVACTNLNVFNGSRIPQCRPSLSEPGHGILHGANASVRYCLALVNGGCAHNTRPKSAWSRTGGATDFAPGVQPMRVSKAGAAVACAGSTQVHELRHVPEQLQKVLNRAHCRCAC